MALNTANGKGLITRVSYSLPRRGPGNSALPRIFLNHHKAGQREAILIFHILIGEKTQI